MESMKLPNASLALFVPSTNDAKASENPLMKLCVN
jgi:hypothetical protein